MMQPKHVHSYVWFFSTITVTTNFTDVTSFSTIVLFYIAGEFFNIGNATIYGVIVISCRAIDRISAGIVKTLFV